MPFLSKTPPKQPASPARESRWTKWWFRIQFVLSLAIAGGVLAYIAWMPTGLHRPEVETPRIERESVVEAVGPGLVRVDPESSLFRKLRIDVAESREITSPKLQVTGTVVASLRPVGEAGSEEWQFDDPEVLEVFHEWQRVLIDINFAEEQVERIKELTETRTLAQRKIVERLERLVAAGTDTAADLEEARAELLEREIEGRREIHEAETELRRAHQEEAVLVRRLQLVGLEPATFDDATKDIDVVVADVPEESQHLVRVGQQCEARFFGLRREVFPGVVRSIAPVLSPERRSLRVLFFVDDPDDKLRPGMFAEIGMGTEPREAILIPESSIIHIGREDYVFVQGEEGEETWRVVPVEVGDTVNGLAEMFTGLNPGDRIITEGAILLKPAAAASLTGNTDARSPYDADPLSPAPAETE